MAVPTVVPMVVLMVVLTVVPMAVLMVVLTVVLTVVLMVVPMAVLMVVPMAALTVVPMAARGADIDEQSATQGGPVRDRPALRRCTAVDLAQFAAQVWGRAASLSRAGELGSPDGYADLLSLAAVDRLVSGQGLRTPFLRVARDGRTIPTASFTRGGGVGAGITDQVADDSLARLFADGATLVLQGLHRTHPPLVELAQALSRDLGHPVQVNAYVTPPQSRGFDDHYDVHDVFVLQVVGEKHWVVRAPVRTSPGRDELWTERRDEVDTAARAEPLLEVTLRPGDALYLPRGFLHSARALGSTSVHLTVGIHSWTRAHVLEQVLTALGGVEALRGSLPLGVDVSDPAALREELTETVRLVRAHLDDVTAEQVAAGLGPLATAAVRAEPVPPMAQATAVADCDETTVVRWRRGLAATLTDLTDGVEVSTAEITVTLPAGAREPVQALLDGATLTATGLATLDPGDRLDPDASVELVRLLLRQALVVRG